MTNYLSIDFESWAYPDLPEFRNLTSQERKRLDGGYVKYSAEKILSILKKHKTKITFFVLGQLYEWYPQIIEEIAKEGHEIAYHTHTHEILASKEILINTLRKSEKFLKVFRPKGFRAPNIFLKQEYYRILREFGFRYSSSVYGSYSSRRTVDKILEVPVSQLFRLPIGSGYFIALLGRQVDWFYRGVNQKGDPVVAFVHNWQIVKPQKATFPNFNYLLKKPYYLPYTFEIDNTFEYLLQSFSFMPMKNLIKED